MTAENLVCPECGRFINLAHFKKKPWTKKQAAQSTQSTQSKIINCEHCGEELEVTRRNKPSDNAFFKNMTDKEKVSELLNILDDSLYIDEKVLRNKTLSSCGMRYCFDDGGDITKVQVINGADKKGYRRYTTIGESVRTD